MKHAKTVNESPTKSTLKSKVTKKSASTPSKSHSTEAGSKCSTNDIDRLLFEHVLADYDTFTAFFPGLSKKDVSVIKQDEFDKLAGKAVKEIPEFAQMLEAKLVKRLKDRMARLKIIAKGFEYLTREKSHADGERESQLKKSDPTWKEGVLKLKEFIAHQRRDREKKIKQKYGIPGGNSPSESDEDSASEEFCAANGLPESLVQESIDAAPFHMNMTQGTSTSSENSIPQIFPSNDYFTYTDAPTQFFPSLPTPALSVYTNSEVTHMVSNQAPYVAGSTEFTGWGNPPPSNCVWPISANPDLPCGQSLLFQNVPPTLHIPSDTVIAHKQGQDPPPTFVPSTYGITYEQALEPSSPLQVFSQQDQGTSSQSDLPKMRYDFYLDDLVDFIKFCNRGGNAFSYGSPRESQRFTTYYGFQVAQPHIDFPCDNDWLYEECFKYQMQFLEEQMPELDKRSKTYDFAKYDEMKRDIDGNTRSRLKKVCEGFAQFGTLYFGQRKLAQIYYVLKPEERTIDFRELTIFAARELYINNTIACFLKNKICQQIYSGYNKIVFHYSGGMHNLLTPFLSYLDPNIDTSGPFFDCELNISDTARIWACDMSIASSRREKTIDAPTQFFPSLPTPALSVYTNSEVTHMVSNQAPYVAGSTEFTGWGNPPPSNCVWPISANPDLPCGQSLLFQNVPPTLHIPSDTVIAHKQGQDPPPTFVPSTYGITYEQALEPSSPLQVFSQQDQGTSSQSDLPKMRYDFYLDDLVDFIKFCNRGGNAFSYGSPRESQRFTTYYGFQVAQPHIDFPCDNDWLYEECFKYQMQFLEEQMPELDKRSKTYDFAKYDEMKRDIDGNTRSRLKKVCEGFAQFGTLYFGQRKLAQIYYVLKPEERTIDFRELTIFAARELYINNTIACFLKNKICQQIYSGYNKIVFHYSGGMHNLLTPFLSYLDPNIDTSGPFFDCELNISDTANGVKFLTHPSHGKSFEKTKQVQEKYMKRKTSEKPKPQLILSLIEEGCETLPIRLERNPGEDFGFIVKHQKVLRVEKNGIANGKLRVHDKIMAVNGVALSRESRIQPEGVMVLDLQISRPVNDAQT